MTSDSKSLADIRSDVCDATLLWFTAAATPALFFSPARAVERGWLPMFWPQIFALTSLVAIAAFRKKLPFGLRAGAIVGLTFATALTSPLLAGHPTSIALFVSGIIMAGVFFGERAGIAGIVFSAAALPAIYFAY